MISPRDIILAIGILILIPVSTGATSSSDSCPPPRSDPKLLEYLLKAGSELQGVKPHHSGGGGIATLRQLTETHSRIFGKVFDLIGFTFYADRLDSSNIDVVRVSVRDLWCLARPGDTVLLSDEVTHHYTTIYSIDRTNDWVYFLDSWPDQFFLLPGRNQEDISAEVVQGKDGTKLLRITKSEFGRVALGLSTLDDLRLFDYYLAINSDAQKTSTVYVQFSYAALASGKNVFVPQALEILRKGLTVAEDSGNDELALWVASRMEFALLAAIHGITGEKRKEYLLEKQAQLHEGYDESELTALFSEQDYYALATTAIRRAKVYLAQKKYDQAIENVNTAQEYTSVLARTREQRGEKGPVKATTANEDREVTPQAFLSLSENVLFTRGVALWFQDAPHHCKAVPGIMGDGRFLTKVLPNHSSGYTLLGLCQAVLHDQDARANLNRALELETDEVAITNLKHVLASLGAQP